MKIEFNDILYAALTVMLPLILRYVFQFVSMRFAETKYAHAVDSVLDAVEYVNQTFVNGMKEAGNFDADAKKFALQKAKTAALEVMEAGTKHWLEKSISDIDTWLEIKIESAVKNSKGRESYDRKTA